MNTYSDVLGYLEGDGWIRQWGGQIEEIRQGDVVRIPPGQKHWHWAGATTGMTHIVIQEQLDGMAVEWMEQVNDEQYPSDPMQFQEAKMTRCIRRAINKGTDTKIWACLVIMVCIFTMAGIVEGEQKGKMNPEIFLPAEAAGWKWDGKEMKYNSKTLFDYIDGAAELYLAYGFQGLNVRKFEKPGQPSITVELYEMASSEDAYGLFSFERQDEAVGIGQGSEFGGGLLRFWKGKYFVSIYSDGGGVEAESAILTMGRATADLIQGTGPEPELVDLIPGKDLGLVDRSVRYLKSHILLNQRFFIAHENILNLSPRTEAVLAQYTREKQKTHLLVIRYPSVKEATDAYQSFMGVYLPDAGGKDLLRTEEQKWTMARQRGEVVIVVFGAPTAGDAESLFKATEEKLLRPRRREIKE